MATFPIRVVIDPSGAIKGAGRVKSELSGVDKTAKSMGDSIKRAFAVVGASLGAREVVKLADSFTFLQNQLRTVTRSADETKVVFNEVLGVANRTRLAIEDTSVAYARFRRASILLGKSQQEVIEFTESVSQAIKLQGATEQEARNGLIQFSQALATGALRGDEFRSVNEQIPKIMDVVRQHLGLTQGELIKMAHAGELTADKIFAAFKEAGPQLAKEFEGLTPTVTGQLTVLKNNFVVFLGQLQPVFTALGTAIRFVADNMAIFATIVGAAVVPAMLRLIAATIRWIALKFAGVLISVAEAAASALAVLHSLPGAIASIGSSFPGLVGAIKGVTLALGVTGLAGAVAAIGTAIALLPLVISETDKIAEEIIDTSDSVGEAQQRLQAEFERVGIAAPKTRKQLEEHYNKVLEDAEKNTVTFGKSLENMARRLGALEAGPITSAFNKWGDNLSFIIGRMRVADDGQRNLNDRIKSFIGIMKVTLPVVIDDYVDKLEKAREAWKKFLEDVQQTEDRLDPASAAHREFHEQLDLLFKAYETGVIPTTERYIELVGLLTKEYDEKIDKLRKLNDEMLKLDELMRKAINDSKDFDDWIGNAIPGEDELNAFDDLIENMQDAIELQRLSADERRRELAIRKAIQELEERQGEPVRDEQEASIVQNVNAYYDLLDVQRQQQEQQQASIALAQQFSSTIVDAAFEGDQSFGEFFRSLLKNIAKAIVQALVLKAILTAIGVPQSQQSGALGPVGKLLFPGFAHGGGFTVGGFGGTDSQLVAFRATPGEHVEVRTPQQVASGQGSGSPVNVTAIIVSNEEEAAARYVQSKQAGEAIMVHLSNNRSRLKGVLAT